MPTMVISGSAREQEAIQRWIVFWQRRGYEVIAYPSPIPANEFQARYPGVLRAFYERLAACDALFVVNEDRDSIRGYVGAATFGEISYAIARNACEHQPVEIVLLQPVSDEVHGADEIRLWSELGWITFHEAG